MIGMSFAIPARRDGKSFLWSHVTGVLRAYQAQGVGLALKRHQRDWALAHGYDQIRWTFDPLQRGNANFNFNVLNTTAPISGERYIVNPYGDMDDDINHGIPSDRLEAVWHIARTPQSHDPHMHRHAHLLLSSDYSGAPQFTPSSWTAPAYQVAVPQSLARLREQQADLPLRWRLALREVLQSAFAYSYHIGAFVDNAYLLYKD
jgi:predicted GNAT superfamily acetyltransferase